MKRAVLALALFLLPVQLAFAQDKPGKMLLENEQIKVREIRLAPGSRQPAQARPNTFLYALTDGALVFTPPGRTAYELIFKAGEALWIPSQETATANESDKEVRALVVEIRDRPTAAAKAVPAKKEPASKAGKTAGKKASKPAAKNTSKPVPAKKGGTPAKKSSGTKK